MIKAIIFDMDGLMIDSEPFHLKAFNKVLSEFGHRISEEDNSRYVGSSNKYVSDDIVRRFHLPIPYEEVQIRKKKAYRVMLKNKVEPLPGIIELVKQLKDHYMLAVASNSHKEEIKTVLSKLNILEDIKLYISADLVKRAKPAPDIYLLVAEKLNLDPKECLVLEDAPYGVISAKAAGMLCYAVPSRETRNMDFSNADKVFESLDEVGEFLG